jgi:hypothetical protein
MKPAAPVIAPEGGCPRLACCIPFCRRTFRNDKASTPWPKGSEVMCGKHYRLAPLELRQRDRKLKRLVRKIDRLMNGRKRFALRCRVIDWQWQCFNKIKQAVTERAGGIG